MQGGAFVRAGALDVAVLPDDEVNRLGSLLIANVPRPAGADQASCPQRVGQEGDLRLPLCTGRVAHR